MTAVCVMIECVAERPKRVPCVGAIVRDQAGRLLLIRRARPPAAGLWSLPGGRVEAGELDAAAVVREVREETGLLVSVGVLAGRVSLPGLDGAIVDIADYVCTVRGGDLVAGDDAADARWVTAAELVALPTTDGLVEALTSWGALPD